MRAIDPSRQARKFLAGVPPKHGRQLGEKLAALRADPQPHDAIQLSGQPYWRVTVGEYRIIYQFDEVTLFVVLVGKRNDGDVYRQLKRMGDD